MSGWLVSIQRSSIHEIFATNPYCQANRMGVRDCRLAAVAVRAHGPTELRQAERLTRRNEGNNPWDGLSFLGNG